MPRADAELDEIRRLIVERASDVRLTLAQLSRMAGKNEAYVHQFVYRGTPRRLPEDVRHAIAGHLRIPEARLRPPAAPGFAEGDAPMERSQQSPSMQRDVPTFVQGGAVDLHRAAEFSPRPPQLVGAAGVFALWVTDSGTRWRPGDLVYARAGQPPRPGDSVVAVRDQRAEMLGDLVSADADGCTIRSGDAERHVKRDRYAIYKIAVAVLA